MRLTPAGETLQDEILFNLILMEGGTRLETPLSYNAGNTYKR